MHNELQWIAADQRAAYTIEYEVRNRLHTAIVIEATAKMTMAADTFVCDVITRTSEDTMYGSVYNAIRVATVVT